jgi:hypothetical protein
MLSAAELPLAEAQQVETPPANQGYVFGVQGPSTWVFFAGKEEKQNRRSRRQIEEAIRGV